jgi:hypothetical protein
MTGQKTWTTLMAIGQCLDLQNVPHHILTTPQVSMMDGTKKMFPQSPRFTAETTSVLHMDGLNNFNKTLLSVNR